jgi:hypothetical protein
MEGIKEINIKIEEGNTLTHIVDIPSRDRKG